MEMLTRRTKRFEGGSVCIQYLRYLEDISGIVVVLARLWNGAQPQGMQLFETFDRDTFLADLIWSDFQD
jgi:hypothetical protein